MALRGGSSQGISTGAVAQQLTISNDVIIHDLLSQVFLSPGADTVTARDLRRIAASTGRTYYLGDELSELLRICVRTFVDYCCTPGNLEITDEELEEMINEADQKGTGDVSPS